MKITIFCLCTSSIKFNLIKKKFEKSNNAFDITRIESTSQFNDFQLLKNPDAFIIYDENPDIIKSLIDYIKTCYPKTPVIAITDSKTEKEIVDSFYYENYLIISTAFIDTLPTFIGKILKIDTDTNNEKDKINDSYSLRNLKYVLDNIPEIVYIKNLDDFTLVYLNKSGELITGYKKEEVIGRKVQDIFIFDKDNYVENKICESLIENEIMEVTDNSILTKNNLVKVFSTKKILLNDDHGHPKYIISVSSEKIDSTKTEKELQKSLIRFSKMFHSSPIPIAMVREKDNVFIDINKSYLEMLGFEREEVIGNKPEILDIWDNFNYRIQIINLAKQNSTVLN
ncbi:MAG: PAS domain-containing protein, partial [Bacteroidota bacterium]